MGKVILKNLSLKMKNLIFSENLKENRTNKSQKMSFKPNEEYDPQFEQELERAKAISMETYELEQIQKKRQSHSSQGSNTFKSSSSSSSSSESKIEFLLIKK